MAMRKFEILNLICNSCNLTSKEILVAHYFIYKSNQEGMCYPSVNTIAAHCGVSERTIQRATKKLQERGYISINKRDINGKQTSNSYQLILSEGKKEIVHALEIGIDAAEDNITTKSLAAEEQMNVVSLEELLMANEDEDCVDRDAVMDSYIPSSAVDIFTDNIATEELPMERMEGIQIKAVACCGNMQDTDVVYSRVYVADGSGKQHKDPIIQITVMLWISDRILYICKTMAVAVNYGCFIRKINAGYVLALHRYDLHRINFFNVWFRGDTMTPELYNKGLRYGKEGNSNG